MTDDEAAAAVGVPEWTIGDRIRKARRVADMSQQELADAIGVAVARLGNWEAGYNKPGDVVAVARAISRVTGVRADWIAGLYPDVPALRSASGGSLTRRDTLTYRSRGMRTRSSLLARHPVPAS